MIITGIISIGMFILGFILGMLFIRAVIYQQQRDIVKKMQNDREFMDTITKGYEYEQTKNN